MCMLCRSLFVHLFLFFWPVFDIQILITPLVSSSSSYRCDGIKSGSVPPKNTHCDMLLIRNCCEVYSTYIKRTLNARCVFDVVHGSNRHLNPQRGINTGHISTARCSGKECFFKFVCFPSKVKTKNKTLISFYYQ
jgi:hypothetical protein